MEAFLGTYSMRTPEYFILSNSNLMTDDLIYCFVATTDRPDSNVLLGNFPDGRLTYTQLVRQAAEA